MLCSQCCQEKPVEDFRKNKRKCKRCEADNAKLRREKNKDVINKKQRDKNAQKRLQINKDQNITDDTKKCNECDLVKNITEFSKGRHKCKGCIKTQDRKRYNKNRPVILSRKKKYATGNKEKVKLQRKKYRDKKRKELLETTQKCSKCKKRKLLNEFPKYGNEKKCRNYCRECGRLMCKNYKKGNRDKVSDYNKKYKSEHKSDITQYNRVWSSNRRKTNEQYKIKNTLRIRTIKALKGSAKLSTTMKLLGCSLEFLIKWFKFRFTEDMTMSNHGKIWHIDHVIPCSKFDLINDEQQKKCFHWTNVQPLHGARNIKKGDSFDMNEIINQAKKISEFTNLDYKNTQDKYKFLITKLS